MTDARIGPWRKVDPIGTPDWEKRIIIVPRLGTFSQHRNENMTWWRNENHVVSGQPTEQQIQRLEEAIRHGGPRPGAGRRHLDGTPPGNDAADPAERHTVTMPASYWDVIKAEGGTYSAGVRKIVEFWLDSIDEGNNES